ncbi:sucrase-isomaltase, partial [Mycoplasmopsis synoviae]
NAIKHIVKDFKTLESNPAFALCSGDIKFLKEFNKKAFVDKPDAYTFGEASSITADEVLKYASGKKKVADNYYNFAWWWIGWGKLGRNEYNPNWE